MKKVMPWLKYVLFILGIILIFLSTSKYNLMFLDPVVCPEGMQIYHGGGHGFHCNSISTDAWSDTPLVVTEKLWKIQVILLVLGIACLLTLIGIWLKTGFPRISDVKESIGRVVKFLKRIRAFHWMKVTIAPVILGVFISLFPILFHPEYLYVSITIFIVWIIILWYRIFNDEQHTFREYYYFGVPSGYIGVIIKTLSGYANHFLHNYSGVGIWMWWMAIPVVVLFSAVISGLVGHFMGRNKRLNQIIAPIATSIISFLICFFGFVYFYAQ